MSDKGEKRNDVQSQREGIKVEGERVERGSGAG